VGRVGLPLVAVAARGEDFVACKGDAEGATHGEDALLATSLGVGRLRTVLLAGVLAAAHGVVACGGVDGVGAPSALLVESTCIEGAVVGADATFGGDEDCGTLDGS
jgi:hypothetical protein